MKYKIKYKNGISYGNKIIEADTKLEAMKKFNNKYRFYNLEIVEVMIEGDKMKEESKNSIALKDYIQLKNIKTEKLDNLSDMLTKTNEILFEQLEKIKDIDTENKEKAELEISKNNSISIAGKTLIQSIGMQMMIEKQKGI